VPHAVAERQPVALRGSRIRSYVPASSAAAAGSVVVGESESGFGRSGVFVIVVLPDGAEVLGDEPAASSTRPPTVAATATVEPTGATGA
jgi:hypothetical protein